MEGQDSRPAAGPRAQQHGTAGGVQLTATVLSLPGSPQRPKRSTPSSTACGRCRLVHAWMSGAAAGVMQCSRGCCGLPLPHLLLQLWLAKHDVLEAGRACKGGEPGRQGGEVALTWLLLGAWAAPLPPPWPTGTVQAWCCHPLKPVRQAGQAGRRTRHHICRHHS